MIESHLSPLIDRGDFVKVFLNERQHLPRESRRRIGRWSRGLERIFEDVIREGVAKGEFRADLDIRACHARHSRHVQCGIELGSARKISRSREIAKEFARLVVDGMGKRRTTRDVAARRRRLTGHRLSNSIEL